MDVTALVTWILTALGGLTLLGTWVSRRRATPGTAASRIGPGLLAAHAGLAALGLVVWLVYVLGDEGSDLPMIALVILLVAAALGFTMFSRWLADRRHEPVPDRPEQGFPVAVVALHGLFGAVTLGLVAWVALGS